MRTLIERVRYGTCKLAAVTVLATSLAVSSTALGQPQGARFSPATLQRGIEAFLRERIGDSDEISILAPLDEVRFDRPFVVAYCRLPDDRFWGRTVVEVSFQADGEELRRLRVPIKITPRRMVPVAKRPLQRGETIESGDVIYELRDATGFMELLPDSVIGLRAAQSIAAGTPLLRTYVVGGGSIRSGESVNLILRSGAISIRTTANVLQNAEPGDRVKVRRSDTGAVLVGTLADRRTVIVELNSHQSQPIGQAP